MTKLRLWRAYLIGSVLLVASLMALNFRARIDDNYSYIPCRTELDTPTLVIGVLIDLIACITNLALFIKPLKKVGETIQRINRVAYERGRKRDRDTFRRPVSPRTRTYTGDSDGSIVIKPSTMRVGSVTETSGTKTNTGSRRNSLDNTNYNVVPQTQTQMAVNTTSVSQFSVNDNYFNGMQNSAPEINADIVTSINNIIANSMSDQNNNNNNNINSSLNENINDKQMKSGINLETKHLKLGSVSPTSPSSPVSGTSIGQSPSQTTLTEQEPDFKTARFDAMKFENGGEFSPIEIVSDDDNYNGNQKETDLITEIDNENENDNENGNYNENENENETECDNDETDQEINEIAGASLNVNSTRKMDNCKVADKNKIKNVSDVNTYTTPKSPSKTQNKRKKPKTSKTKDKSKVEARKRDELHAVAKKYTVLTSIGVGTTFGSVALIGIIGMPIVWYVITAQKFIL